MMSRRTQQPELNHCSLSLVLCPLSPVIRHWPGTRDQGSGTIRQRGSALVEFGLILPVFLLLTFGIIDFGRGIWAYNTLAHAAREAARYAIVRGATNRQPATASDIKGIVQSQAAGLDPKNLAVTVSWQPDNKPGSVVQVKAQYSFKPVTQLFGNNTIVLQSTSQMVISY